MNKSTDEQTIQSLLNEIDHAIFQEEDDDELGFLDEIEDADMDVSSNSSSVRETEYNFRTKSNTFNYSLDQNNNNNNNNKAVRVIYEKPFTYPDDAHTSDNHKKNNSNNSKNTKTENIPMEISNTKRNSDLIEDILNEIKKCYEDDW